MPPLEITPIKQQIKIQTTKAEKPSTNIEKKTTTESSWKNYVGHGITGLACLAFLPIVYKGLTSGIEGFPGLNTDSIMSKFIVFSFVIAGAAVIASAVVALKSNSYSGSNNKLPKNTDNQTPEKNIQPAPPKI